MRPIDYFDIAADARAAHLAVVDGTTRLTFGELRRLSDAIACGLGGLDTPEQPRRIAILSRNDHRVIACALATMRAGHTIVPIHAQSTPDDIAAALARASPDYVFYHSSLCGHLQGFRHTAAHAVTWVCLDTGDGPDPSLAAFGAAGGAVSDWGSVREDSSRPVYLRQTSGTTGAPKLVLDDIQSFNASQRALRHVVRASDDAVFLAAAPLSHACGVFAFTLLTSGATVVILPGFDVAEVFAAIREHRVTHLWLPPTALALLLDAPEARAYDHTSSPLRSLMLGASAVSPGQLRGAVDTFGPIISLNYSQIESGFLTWLDAETLHAAALGCHPERLGSSGKSLGVARIAIMDDAGRLLPYGETGEIVVRGASVKDYASADDTVAARSHGWHHTGDLGHFDDHGYLYVTGRTKDVIVSGGFKIPAAAVERVVLELPEILECAAVPVADAFRGESVLAVVVLKQGRALDSQSVLRHCRDRLGAARAPRAVVSWPILPRTSVGKVDKRAIGERIRANHGGPAA